MGFIATEILSRGASITFECRTIFFIINLQLCKKQRKREEIYLFVKISYTYLKRRKIFTEKKARTIEKFKMHLPGKKRVI